MFEDIIFNISHFLSEFMRVICFIDWQTILICLGFLILTTVIIGVRDALYKCSYIHKHFDSVVPYRGYIKQQFYESVRRYSRNNYDKYDYDYIDKEIEVYNDFDELVFDHDDDGIFFSQGFQDYILRYHSDYKLYDLSKAVIKYRRYCVSQSERQLNFEQKTREERNSLIHDAILDSKLGRNKSIYESAEIDKKDFEKSYFDFVQDLRQNNFVGLMPVCNLSNKKLESALKDLFIVPQERVPDMLNGTGMEDVDVEGVLICYDTYSEKYYIFSADHILQATGALFDFDGSNEAYDDTFKADIHIGHKIVIKLLPLYLSDYTDVNLLCRDLVEAYDSEYPHGYNCRLYNFEGKS